jgi:hypothetical protein
MWLITGFFKYIKDTLIITKSGGTKKDLIFDPNHPDATFSVLGTTGYRQAKWGYAFKWFISGGFWVFSIICILLMAYGAQQFWQNYIEPHMQK